jgi:hypothetical protein
VSNFNLSSVADKINKTIDEHKLQKVCMQGCYKDLERLKPVIEKLYDEHISYLSYWKSDCPYFGWEWDKDDGRMKNQADITDGITHKIEEIYAIILAGLGERCEKN